MKNHLSIIVWATLLGLVQVACANDVAPSSVVEPISDTACNLTPKADELRASLESWFEDKGELHAFDSLVVDQCNERLFAAGFGGFELDEAHEIQSATKTLSAIAIGAALQEGLIGSLDQTLESLLPDYSGHLVGKKKDITLRDILSMRTGLAWRDFGLGNSFRKVEGAENSVTTILDERLTSDPGTAFFYNTGSSHLLSAIVETVSGYSTEKFLQTRVLDPIGVTSLEWKQTRDGLSKGGWDAFLSPNDMAKIGEMLLQGGISPEGQVLLPESFVEDMLRPHSENAFGEHGYGYQAWVVKGYGTDVAGARGYGQQNIFVLRDLDAVVVTTANIFYPNENGEMVDDLMVDLIVPALKNEQ